MYANQRHILDLARVEGKVLLDLQDQYQATFQGQERQ